MGFSCLYHKLHIVQQTLPEVILPDVGTLEERNFDYNIVRFDASLIEQRRQLNRMNDIHRKHNRLAVFLTFPQYSNSRKWAWKESAG